MNYKASIPSVDTIQLQYMKSIDLSDYYTNAREWGFIFCQICKLNIPMQSVFEHSTTKRHKYNKLFFGIVQGLSSNVDTDFIVLHIDSLQCRYCDSVIIKSDREALVTDHIQDVRHCSRRQYYLDRTDAGNLLKPLDTLITYASNIRKKKNPITQTTKYLRDMNYKNQINALQNRGYARDSLGVEAGTNIREKNNIGQIRSVVLRDRETRNRVELEDCIRIGEGGACMCTLCGVKVPNNPHNIDMHVNGKYHKKAYKIVSELPYFISNVKNGARSCTICLIEISNVYRNIEEHINSQMHRNETLRLLQSTSENSEEKVVKTSVAEFKVTSNIEQGNIMQYSRFSRDYEYQRREELPQRSTIRANGPCMCPYCVLSLAAGMDFVGVHPNCTKNRRPMVPLTRFKNLEPEARSSTEKDSSIIKKTGLCMCPNCVPILRGGTYSMGVESSSTKLRRAVIPQAASQNCESEARSFTSRDRLFHRLRQVEEQRSERMQPSGYRTTGEITHMRNFREPNNIGQTKYVRVQEEQSLCFILFTFFLTCFLLFYLWIHYSSSRH